MTCPTVALHTRVHAGSQWTLSVLNSKCRIPIMVRVVGGAQDLTETKTGTGARNSPVGGSAAKADTCHTPRASPTETLPLQFPWVPQACRECLRMPVLPRCDSFPPGFTGALNSNRAWATSGELGNVVFHLSGACGLGNSGSVH